MAEPHAHSQPIQTYGPAPHNRNIWPHNSQAAVFCLRFWPILLFAPAPASYPLLTYTYIHIHTYIYMHTYTCIHINTYIYEHTYIYIHMYVCMRVYYVCTYV